MELQLRVNARYAPQKNASLGDVLRHFESPTWVRLVLKQVLPQLKQTSPTDPNMLIKMALDASERSRRSAEQLRSCSICMATNALPSDIVATSPLGAMPDQLAPIKLPCGHWFHTGCVLAWLQRRSTCPLCRLQLPRAYTGKYAITAVRSTLVVPQVHETFSSSTLQDIRVGKNQELLAIVEINMLRMTSSALDSSENQRQPCAVTASVKYVNDSSAAVRPSKREREEAVSSTPVTTTFKRVRASVDSSFCER